MPTISLFERAGIIALSDAGHSGPSIQRQMGHSKHGISLVIQKWRAERTTKNKRRGHQAKNQGRRSGRWLKWLIIEQPRLTLTETQQALYLYLGLKLHKSTVGKYLHLLGFNSYVAARIS